MKLYNDLPFAGRLIVLLMLLYLAALHLLPRRLRGALLLAGYLHHDLPADGARMRAYGLMPEAAEDSIRVSSPLTRQSAQSGHACAAGRSAEQDGRQPVSSPELEMNAAGRLCSFCRA